MLEGEYEFTFEQDGESRTISGAAGTAVAVPSDVPHTFKNGGAALENLRTVLEQAGTGLDAVVKLTIYLTDMSRLRELARIKGEFFAGEQPASTAVGVTALARPEMMVEVEAVAVA